MFEKMIKLCVNIWFSHKKQAGDPNTCSSCYISHHAGYWKKCSLEIENKMQNFLFPFAKVNKEQFIEEVNFDFFSDVLPCMLVFNSYS